MKYTMTILAALLLSIPSLASELKPDPAIVAALKPLLKSNDVPALAGAIVTGDGLVGVGAAGVRKADDSTPVTIEDLWHLGSDTKAMTATLIGSLVEKGKLGWGDTLEKRFPDIAPSLPAEMRKITLLELLTHRSGFPTAYDWRGVPQKGTLPAQRRLVVKSLASMKLESTPGSKFEYANLNYVLAAAMAEKATGRPWETLISDAIFKPLGMKSVGFGGTGTPGIVDQPWPHSADGKPYPINGPVVDNPPVMAPAGTVHCKIEDWAKFIRDQLRGEEGKSALFKTATYRKLHEPATGGDYALGWIVTQRDWGGGTVWTHAGSNTLNYCVVWTAPKRDFAVLVCCNQGGDAAAKACDQAASALIQIYLNRKSR